MAPLILNLRDFAGVARKGYKYERSMIDKLVILSPNTPAHTNAAPYTLIDANTSCLDKLM